MKPTPGPWGVEYDNSDYGWGYKIGPAEIWSSYNCSDETEGRVRADARLIAMATEMRDMLVTLERSMIISTTQDMRNLDRIREILAYIEDGQI